MKTKVKIIENVRHCEFKKGDKGYIDGYMRAADNLAYAIVVVGKKVDFTPLYALEVLRKDYNIVDY